MKTFYTTRDSDESGVSGTGKVLEGAIFDDGVCVIHWCVKNLPTSTTVFQSFEDFERIHITSHPTNGTKLFFNADIPLDVYEGLKARDEELTKLEDYGVDNWQGYEDALREES